MIRLIPPVAVPFGPQAIAASLVGSAATDAGSFSSQLAVRFHAARVLLAGSGRAALAATLSAVRRAERNEVLVPAYTCWSVPAAAVRAGYRVRLYDIDPSTFLPAGDLGDEAGADTTAIVLADLLSGASGFESAARAVAARLPECLLVEDRAQSWPSRASQSGVTLLSFGRGKPLPLGHGGAILTQKERLPLEMPATRGGGGGDAAALAVAATFGHPLLFRFPAAIPALGIGATVYDPSFDAERPFHRWQERLGVRLIPKMDELQRRRARHAARLAEVVRRAKGWTVGPLTGGPLRLPIYAPDRAARDGAVTLLRKRGVSASALYPGTLLDIPALRPHLSDASVHIAGAREIADRLLALPVYPTLVDTDIDRIGAAFAAAVARRSP